MASLLYIQPEIIAPGAINGIKLIAKHFGDMHVWMNWEEKKYGGSKYHTSTPMLKTTMWGHHEMHEQAWGNN